MVNNKPQRRLLATDLDGTFLDSAGSVTPQNRDAVQKANENGLNIVFVTGRPARWLRGVAEASQHFALMIGGNGGFIADMQSMTVVSNNAIDTTAALNAVERVLDRFPDATFGIERSYVGMPIAQSHADRYDEMRVDTLSEYEFAVTAGYVPAWNIAQAIPVAPIAELVQLSDITKIIIKPGDPTDWNSDTWLAEIAPLVSDVVQVTHASQEIVLAEISALGITKATALAQIAQSFGLTENDCVAVGDMPNDVPMLEWVAEPWTVANAHEEVLAVTNNVLPHHDESPVALLIEDLLSR